MSEVFDAVFNYEYRAAAPLLEDWQGSATLRTALRAELEESLEGAVRVQCGQTLREVENGDRFFLELDEGRFIVALYQHDVESATDPNVVLLHHSFPIENEASASLIRRVICGTFSSQPISQIRFFQFGQQPPPIESCHVNDRFVAGPVSEIASKPLPDGLDDLRLQPPDSMAFYEQYCQWYHEFWTLRPQLRSLVRIEPREDMKDCLEDGGVRWLVLDGETCGMVAAERSRQFGMSGWQLREKVIAPAYWGRGLSIAGNILLARDLPAAKHELMWGSISPQNIASWRSAERAGRRTIGNTCRLEFEHN